MQKPIKRSIAALAIASWAAASMLACSGDDIMSTPSDAGHGDATQADAANDVANDVTSDVTDGGARDADAGADADAAEETGCVPFDAGTLDAAVVQTGYQLMQMLNCQHCHGQTLTGNSTGIGSQYGVGYPPNLTPDPTTGLGCWTDDEIARAILDGIDDQGQTLCPIMPRFSDAGIGEAGARALVAFLRSIPVAQNQVPSSMCTLDAGDAAHD